MRRMTNQKKLLFAELKLCSAFFDAYKFHARVAKKNKGIGLATIYRFLNTLEADGEIHSFSCDNKKIYSHGSKSHAHFKCEKCGSIKHLKIRNVDFLKEFIADEICHFQIELTGMCEPCRMRIPS